MALGTFRIGRAHLQSPYQRRQSSSDTMSRSVLHRRKSQSSAASGVPAAVQSARSCCSGCPLSSDSSLQLDRQPATRFQQRRQHAFLPLHRRFDLRGRRRFDVLRSGSVHPGNKFFQHRVNSSSVNKSRSAVGIGSPMRICSGSNSIGTSQSIVTMSLLNRIVSRLFCSDSR